MKKQKIKILILKSIILVHFNSSISENNNSLNYSKNNEDNYNNKIQY